MESHEMRDIYVLQYWQTGGLFQGYTRKHRLLRRVILFHLSSSCMGSTENMTWTCSVSPRSRPFVLAGWVKSVRDPVNLELDTISDRARVYHIPVPGFVTEHEEQHALRREIRMLHTFLTALWKETGKIY